MLDKLLFPGDRKAKRKAGALPESGAKRQA